ncbi:MAG TPA: LuxR C-terminal-related transcriptional regulator [Acidimicrobiales bacterium]|nr:LuxR C-terminal-related transcriptional regulator [Acidimicrobiales bacterium]
MEVSLTAGRRSFERKAWRDAYAELSSADRRAPLVVDDLERLAVAAYLVGEDEECATLTARAHQECLQQGDSPRAARCAFWLAFGHLMRGEVALAGGWIARAQHLLDEGHHDCVERGFLVVPVALGHLLAGEATPGLAAFSEALAIGERFGDMDLIAFGRLGQGQALVLGGNQQEGVACFDMVMVGVTAGEVSPVVAGLAYCTVIEFCQVTFDVRRAKEWTAALSRWCESQPDLVPYRGQCLVHRAEVLQFNGAWSNALQEAEQACAHLSRPPGHPAVGNALYRKAELHRLRGDFGRAEEAYRAASEKGRDPQPGLARLRLAQGRSAVAASAIRRAVDEAADRISRAHLLAADVEIMLAVGDAAAARSAADELKEIEEALGAPVLRATSGYAMGLVLLAEGDPLAALGVLRPAWATWRDLEAPYEAARTRVAVGDACRRLADEDGAMLEFHAAAGVFRELGATADLVAVETMARPGAPGGPGLSTRELQVLALLATGMTNRSIAVELVVSQKTVARHVANIFGKLGVSSRSAATAYAYEHGLIQGGLHTMTHSP